MRPISARNWRAVSAGGNFYTLNMPVKFTYGPVKNLETYIVAPFLVYWANDVDRGAEGPNGERSAGYAGIGDITTVAKYLVLEEGEISAGGQSGRRGGLAQRPRLASQPAVPGGDAIGTGSFNFTTGVNLFKWVKPFLLYSNIWLNSPVNVFKLSGSDFPQDVRNRENVTFNLAAEYPVNKQWVLLLEMFSTWDLVKFRYGIPGIPIPHHRLGLPAGDRISPHRKMVLRSRLRRRRHREIRQSIYHPDRYGDLQFLTGPAIVNFSWVRGWAQPLFASVND